MQDAQDPSELFDLYAEDGTPLGRRKPRGEVHRDGDWHRSVHVWVALDGGVGLEGAEGGPWLLFQRRCTRKDTWPGALDVAVTGHLRAGEDELDGLREAEEEIGLAVDASGVKRLGRRRRVHDREPGVLDRELQDIFLARTSVRLGALRPDPAELDELVALPFASAGRLFRGEATEARGARVDLAGRVEPVTVRMAEFVVASDGYYEVALRAIERGLAGDESAAWELG